MGYFSLLSLCCSFMKFSHKSSKSTKTVFLSLVFLFYLSCLTFGIFVCAWLVCRVEWFHGPFPPVCLTFRPLTEDWKLSWGNMKHPRLNEILSENSKALFISTNSGEYKKHGAFPSPTQERKSFKMPSMIGQHSEPLLADIKKFIHT